MEAWLSRRPEPAVLLEQVRRNDMRALVNAVWQGFDQRMKDRTELASRASLCGALAHFSERLRLNALHEPAALDAAEEAPASSAGFAISGKNRLV